MLLSVSISDFCGSSLGMRLPPPLLEGNSICWCLEFLLVCGCLLIDAAS